MTAESIKTAMEEAEDFELSFEEEVMRLAGLSPFEYEQQRKPAAKALKIERVVFLDQAVKKARKGTEEDSTKDRKIEYIDTKPWPEPVEGVAVLDEAAELIMRHMVIRDVDAYACVLWAAHSHVFKLFSHSPRLLIDAPDAECGKTLLMSHMVGNLVNKPQSVELMKPAPFFRLAQAHQPTFLIDEVDVFIQEDSDLLAAINGGWEPHGGVPRCVGEDFEVHIFNTFAPTAFAGIRISEKLPATTVSRSVVIHLDRASEYEMLDRVIYDARKHKQEFLTVNRKLARWCEDKYEELSECEPNLPVTIRNREADKWRSLFVIADTAGGHWPERVRAAVAKRHDIKEPSKALQLFIDIQEIFKSDEQLHTSVLIDRLCDLEDSRWADYNFRTPDSERRKLTSRQLANLLRPYGVNSEQIWLNSMNRRGYDKQSFKLPWKRYLPKQAQNHAKGGDTPILSASPLDTNKDKGFSDSYPLGKACDPSTKDSSKPNAHKGSSTLADRKGGSGGKASSDPGRHDFMAGLEEQVL